MDPFIRLPDLLPVKPSFETVLHLTKKNMDDLCLWAGIDMIQAVDKILPALNYLHDTLDKLKPMNKFRDYFAKKTEIINLPILNCDENKVLSLMTLIILILMIMKITAMT